MASRIRAATPADVPAILPLVEKICALHEAWDPLKYGFVPDPSRRYQNWLTRITTDPQAVFWVAEGDPGGLVGFLVATIERTIPLYRLSQYGYIHDLWVDPGFRGLGLGQEMLQQTISHFRQMGIEQIRLETAAANQVGRDFFARYGFRPCSVEMLWDGSGWGTDPVG